MMPWAERSACSFKGHLSTHMRSETAATNCTGGALAHSLSLSRPACAETLGGACFYSLTRLLLGTVGSASRCDGMGWWDARGLRSGGSDELSRLHSGRTGQSPHAHTHTLDASVAGGP